MKKMLKIGLTIIFVIAMIFEIIMVTNNYSQDALGFAVFALAIFLMHLFIWIAPTKIFDLCWKLTKYMPDAYDYETSYGNLDNVGLGVLITSIMFLIISIILTI